jgi:hypothetical protein
MPPESLFQQINKAEQQAQQAESKRQEKELNQQENKNRNKDEVITLNIDGKNRGMREKPGLFRSLVDNVKTTWNSFKESRRQKREMLRVVPEESTTQARYEASLQRGNQAVETASQQVETVVQRGETLIQQRDEIQEMGDMWSNQHEGDYEVSAVAQAPAEVQTSESSIETGDEFVNPYSENKAPGEEVEDDELVLVESAPAKKSAGEAFAEYANQTNEMSKLAEIIRRVNPLKEGNGELALALESGNINSQQKKMVRGALKKLEAMPNWGKADKKVFEAISKDLDADQKRAETPVQEGLGDSLEAKAKELKRQEVFSKLGKLILEHHPLNLDNKALAESFGSDNLGSQDLTNGLKAIFAIKAMGRWDKVTTELLNNAANEIAGLQEEAADNVIPFETGTAKTKEKINPDIAAKAA